MVQLDKVEIHYDSELGSYPGQAVSGVLAVVQGSLGLLLVVCSVA